MCAKIFDLDTSCSKKITNIKISEDLYLENGVTLKQSVLTSIFYEFLILRL